MCHTVMSRFARNCQMIVTVINEEHRQNGAKKWMTKRSMGTGEVMQLTGGEQ